MPHDTIVRQRRGVLLNATKQNSNEVPDSAIYNPVYHERQKKR